MTRIKPLVIISLFLFGIINEGFSQNIGVNSTGANLDALAILGVTSINYKVLIPRVALTGTNHLTTITSPATNLLIFNTAMVASVNSVASSFYYFGGTKFDGDFSMISGFSFNIGAINLMSISSAGNIKDWNSLSSENLQNLEL